MSERAFRAILVIVVAIWVIFVLTPSLADFFPRAWATVQRVLPGDRPRVIVAIKDVYQRGPIDDVRVQIVTSESTLVAISNEQGEAIFEAVPAGIVKEIRAQKLDYEIGLITKPEIPHRQRARFTIIMNQREGRRLYIGHEGTSGSVGLSLLDLSSRLALSAPGGSALLENVPALDLKVVRDRIYLLLPSRVVVVNRDGSIAASLAIRQQPAGFAVSPTGDTVYLLVKSGEGNSYLLTSIDTASWTQRMQISVAMTAEKAVLLPSGDDQRLYLAPIGDQQVSVYDTRAARRQAIFVIGEPIKDAALSDYGRFLYVLGTRRTVPLVIDTGGGSSASPVLGRTTDSVLAGATRLLVAEQYNGRWLCLLQPEAQHVSIIDMKLLEVHQVSVERDAAAFAFDASDGMLYVANRGTNNLTIISLADAAVVDTIDVRSRPAFLAIP